LSGSRAARWSRVPFEPGTRVGNYRVDRLVGTGGVCRVYRATHYLLHTVHALKELISDTRLESRLLREGRLQFSLDANHVVPVTGAFRWRGRTTLVMPFVEGCSLHQLLRAYRPTLPEAAGLFVQMAASLEAIHEADILHRDVKPANVLLDVHRGRVRVRLSDFGLARQATDERRTFGFLGTPQYASPEQHLDAGSATLAADLWPMGLVLCELVSTVDTEELARHRRTSPDDPEALDPVPEPWRSLAHELLAFSPTERPTASELSRRLAGLGVPVDDLTVDGPCAQVVLAHADAAGRQLTTATLHAERPAAETLAPSHPPAFAPHRTHNLPGSRDRFVGRTTDVDAIEAAVGHARLVTLRGPAGVGKTRLALHFSQQSVEAWAGVWWCPISIGANRAEVVQALGRALGVMLGTDPEAQVIEALHARGPCLVVVDDAHHALDVAREVVEAWLDACPEVQLLATSHRALGVAGEHVHVVPPLDLDDAVELLVERSRRAGSTRLRHEPDGQELRELVEELDRLPLAIELAAPRLGTFPVAVLLDHLRADRLELLSQASPSQTSDRTLTAMLEWAWNQVEPEDREALGCLTLIEDPFDFETAAAVIGGRGSFHTMNVMQRLVETSLVQVVREQFVLLNSVRDFAAEQTEPALRLAAAQRHGACFAALGDEASLAELSTHGGRDAWARLTGSLRDLRAACRRAVERGDQAVAGRAARAVWAVLSLTGPLADGAELLEAVLTLEPGDVDLHRWVQLDAARAWSRRGEGERGLAEATGLLQAAAGTEPGDASEALFVAELHETVGGVLQDRGEHSLALEHHEKALAVARRLHNARLEGIALGNIGNVHKSAGRPAEAQRAYEDALRASRRVGTDATRG